MYGTCGIAFTYTRTSNYILNQYVMNAKVLSIMRYQEDVNTEHNKKSICRAAVLAQWAKRLTCNGYTRV